VGKGNTTLFNYQIYFTIPSKANATGTWRAFVTQKKSQTRRRAINSTPFLGGFGPENQLFGRVLGTK
jgi:hypothetical protein